ncbi:hypothetical protein GE191_01005 [Serratia fonticola]|nr:hypothetical protein [Serratia fonticola]NBJ32257.1 hypothetical protein [Serratia fonticola]
MNTLLTTIIILGVIEIGLLARLVCLYCRFRRSYDRKYPQPEERNYD